MLMYVLALRIYEVSKFATFLFQGITYLRANQATKLLCIMNNFSVVLHELDSFVLIVDLNIL